MKISRVDSEAERRLGLSGRESMPKNEGMLFIFDRPGRYAFWMKGMKFPLDFIWISGDKITEITGKVGIDQMNLRPQQPVDKILEVNSGWAAEHQIKIGDTVKYESVSN